MKSILSVIKILPVKLLFAVNLLLIILIGIVDYLTGPEIGFSIFYLLPIAISAWYAGRKSGIILSSTGALIWFIADHFAGHIYSTPVIMLWNSLMRLGLFIIITALISGLKENLDHLHKRELDLEMKRVIMQTSQKLTAIIAENIATQNAEILKWIAKRQTSGQKVSENVERASRMIGSCLQVLSEVSFISPLTTDSSESVESYIELMKSKLEEIQSKYQT